MQPCNQQTTARQADSRCHDGVDGQVRRIKEGLSRLPTQRHLDTYPARYTKHSANPEGVVWSQVLPLLPASALGTPELRWARPAIYSAFYSSLPPKYSPDYLRYLG
ncbi:hypothetical protein NHJ13051_000641, partial [Beauveria bassiana]